MIEKEHLLIKFGSKFLFQKTFPTIHLIIDLNKTGAFIKIKIEEILSEDAFKLIKHTIFEWMCYALDKKYKKKEKKRKCSQMTEKFLLFNIGAKSRGPDVFP